MLLLSVLGQGRAEAQTPTPAPWRAFDIATGGDNITKLIWLTPDNGFQIWNLTANGQNNAVSPLFGPIVINGQSWNPVKLGVGGDGLTRLLLERSDGAVSIWTLNSDLTFGSSSPIYGPYSGSTCVDMTVARDNSVSLLWITGAQFGLWKFAPSGALSYSPTFGPYRVCIKRWDEVWRA